MSRPFISYAREDKAFVLRLERALDAAGSKAWVDWQDIPPSAKWMDEIRRAIVAADAFVFVISPASAASRSCGWEISIAAENNKRIIPLLLVPDESMKLPPAIGDINWIFATTDDEFKAAVTQLTTAIGVDLEWVRWHSRLLNRAHEWQSANAEESLLLRGWDLEDAERRFEKVGDRKPALTELQHQYVACGRWSQRLDEANVLTRQSLVHATRGRHQTAAAYRMRAIELAPQGGAPPQFRASGQKADWAEEAWFLHRYQDRKRGRLRARATGHGAALSALTVGPGERLLASGDFEGGLRVWDAKTGTAMLTMDGAHQGPISAIAFTPDGCEMWTGSEDGRLLIWDLEATQVRPYFPDETDPVTALAFDGDRVAIGLRNGFVVVVDRETNQPVLHATPHSGAVTFLRFQDGRLLTASGKPTIGEWLGDGTVHALSLADERDEVLLFGTLNAIGCVALDPSGRRAVRGMQAGALEVWDLASRKQTGELTGHEGPVVAAVFLANGESVLTAGADRTVRLWDLAAGREQRILDGHLDMTTALAVSADGTTAWTASLDQTIAIWDLEGTADLQTLKTIGVSVGAVATNPAGTRVITGSSEGAIQVWDAATCEALGTLPDAASPEDAHQGDVGCLAWSADGSTIASGGKDSTLHLWNAETGERINRMGHGGEGVTAACFIAGASTALLSASGDRFKAVVDRAAFGAAGGRLPASEIGKGIVLRSDLARPLVQSLERHPTPIDCLAIDGSGLRVVSGSVDATARVWDLESGRQMRLIGVDTAAVVAVAITADGGRVAVGSRDGVIRVWDVDAQTAPITLEGHAAGVGQLAFSPDGTTLISAWSDRSIRLWNCETGTGSLLDGDVLETAVALSADGQTLLTGSFEHVVRVWSVQARKQVSVLPGHTDTVWGVAITPDGQRGLSGSDDGTLRVWDLTSGQQLTVIEGGAGGVKAVAFGADATTAIAASADGLAREWHLERREVIRTFENPAGPASSVGFSPAGPWMVSSSRGGLLAAWHTGRDEPARTLHPRRGGVMALACSPDGGLALVGGVDGSIRVWDLARGAELPSLEGHNATVTGVAFTPAGDVAVSASMDGTLCVWDVKTGTSRHVLIGHTAPLLAVAVSPDGRVAASASEDGTARLWDLRGGQQLDVVRVNAQCLAFDPRGERVWLGSGWRGTAWAWTICDPRTGAAPPGASAADGGTSGEIDELYRSIGLRLTAERRLVLV